MFAKHRKGFVFPVWIVLKHTCHPNGDVQYIGLIKPVRKTTRKEDSQYILIEENGEIAGMTLQISQILGLDCLIIGHQRVNLCMIAPELIKHLEAFDLDNEKETQVEKYRSQTRSVPELVSSFYGVTNSIRNTEMKWKEMNEKLDDRRDKADPVSWNKLLEEEVKLQKNETVTNSIMGKDNFYDEEEDPPEETSTQEGKKKMISDHFSLTIRVPKDIQKYMDLLEYEQNLVSKKKNEAIETTKEAQFFSSSFAISPPMFSSNHHQADKAIERLKSLDAIRNVAGIILNASEEIKILKTRAVVIKESHGPKRDMFKYLKIISCEEAKKAERSYFLSNEFENFQDKVKQNNDRTNTQVYRSLKRREICISLQNYSFLTNFFVSEFGN